MSEYYRAYEERYQAVRRAGGEIWGHSPDDSWLVGVLSDWATANRLSGKRVAEFACGEGAGGVILSRLGCVYNGFDIAPTALEKARALLRDFPEASVRRLDMVRQRLEENTYDGALDISGLHMLVTDPDRQRYLRNVLAALKPGASAYFVQEAYREDAYPGTVESIEEWKRITGLDFDTPEPRMLGETEIMLKLLPARPRTEADYRREMEAAGFIVDDFRVLGTSDFMAASASILARKP